VTGVIVPSDTSAPASTARSAPRAAKAQSAPTRQTASPAGALPTGPRAASSAVPTDGLLAPPDKTVVDVVDQVLGASSESSLQPLKPLLGDTNLLDRQTDDSADDELSSDDSSSARSDAVAHKNATPNEDARTVGPAGDSDVVEVQPGARPSDASVGGTSGVPRLLGAPALLGLQSSQSSFQEQNLEAPEISTPADADGASSVTAENVTTSERQLAVGPATATSLPRVFDETPSWLVSAASGLLLVVGGTSVAYGARRLRRHTT
jgi:hypothetical protein